MFLKINELENKIKLISPRAHCLKTTKKKQTDKYWHLRNN